MAALSTRKHCADVLCNLCCGVVFVMCVCDVWCALCCVLRGVCGVVCCMLCCALCCVYYMVCVCVVYGALCVLCCAVLWRDVAWRCAIRRNAALKACYDMV